MFQKTARPSADITNFKKTETSFSKYNKELSSDVDFIKNSTLFASPSGRITGNNQL